MNADNSPIVLVAEDEPDIRLLLETWLKKSGYTVIAVDNGGAALEAVKEQSPDAVVLDWMMPDIEGAEVCDRLKKDPATRHVPVVLLTARAREQDIARGFEAGADEYLTKPFDFEELGAALSRLLADRNA